MTATYEAKKLAFTQLNNTNSDIYNPTSGSVGLIHNILLHNSGSATEISILNLNDGTHEYELYKLSLASYETVQFSFQNEGLIVDSNSKLTGSTTTGSKVACFVNGSERNGV